MSDLSASSQRLGTGMRGTPEPSADTFILAQRGPRFLT